MNEAPKSSPKGVLFFFRGSGKGKEIAIIRTFAVLVFSLYIPTYLLIVLFPEQLIAPFLDEDSILRSVKFHSLAIFSSLFLYQIGILIAEFKGGTSKKAAALRLLSLLIYYIVAYITVGGISGVGANWKHNFIIGIMWATTTRSGAILTGFLITVDFYLFYFASVGHVSTLFMNTLTALITFSCSALFKNTVEYVLKLVEKSRDEAIIAKNESENHLTNINSILDSDMEIAIAVIDDKKNISHSSSYFKSLFNNANNADEFIQLFDLNNSRKSEICETINLILGEYFLNYEVNQSLLPSTVLINGISHKNEWKTVVKDDVIQKLIFIGSNIDQILKLQEESRRNSELLILQDRCMDIGPKRMRVFLKQNEILLSIAKNKTKFDLENDKDTYKEIFRNLHTIKGNSKSLGFSLLAEAIHKSEDDLKQNNKESLKKSIEDSFAEFEKIKNVCDRLCYSKNYIQLNHDEIEKSLKMGNEHLRQLIINSSYTKLDKFLKSFESELKKIASDLNKCDLNIFVDVPSLYLNKNTENILGECFTHIFRNSVDHSFETLRERRKLGKSDICTLSITAKEIKEYVEIAVTDDGTGLNIDAIRNKAIEIGLIDVGVTNSNTVANIIFENEFTTRDNISDISGRGIGMDVVKNAIQSIGGNCYAKVFSTNSPTQWQLVLQLPLDYFFKNYY